jgi:hypothetical protein
MQCSDRDSCFWHDLYVFPPDRGPSVKVLYPLSAGQPHSHVKRSVHNRQTDNRTVSKIHS